MLAILAVVASQAVAPAPVIHHASKDDCEIIVAIGRAKVGWGDKGPDEPLFIDGPLPDGSDYREDCSWHGLGVGDPVPGTPGKGNGFGIDKPVYGPDGATATTQLSFTVFSASNQRPFLQELSCKLTKRDGHWVLDSCEQGFIT